MDKPDQKSSTLESKGGLVFPTDFTIKIFGKADEQFQKNVLAIIRQHLQHLPENAIVERHSKDKKYLALSVTVHAESKEMLDAIYQDLTKCPDVLMAL
jgi:putative lipoic acid-binding regulatory protein